LLGSLTGLKPSAIRNDMVVRANANLLLPKDAQRFLNEVTTRAKSVF
jgi:hypothetical protein